MLCATLTRVAPGRPEATLAQITVTPRTPRRQQGEHGRYDGHVVVGPGDERDEQHVHITGWDRERPAVDLLQHVLELAQLQRRDEVTADAVYLPAWFAQALLDTWDHPDVGPSDRDGTFDLAEAERMVAQLRRELAAIYAQVAA